MSKLVKRTKTKKTSSTETIEGSGDSSGFVSGTAKMTTQASFSGKTLEDLADFDKFGPASPELAESVESSPVLSNIKKYGEGSDDAETGSPVRRKRAKLSAQKDESGHDNNLQDSNPPIEPAIPAEVEKVERKLAATNELVFLCGRMPFADSEVMPTVIQTTANEDSMKPDVVTKRTMSSFLLWCKVHRAIIRDYYTDATFSELSVLTGQLWRRQPNRVKDAYKEQFKRLNAAIDAKMEAHRRAKAVHGHPVPRMGDPSSQMPGFAQQMQFPGMGLPYGATATSMQYQHIASYPTPYPLNPQPFTPQYPGTQPLITLNREDLPPNSFHVGNMFCALSADGRPCYFIVRVPLPMHSASTPTSPLPLAMPPPVTARPGPVGPALVGATSLADGLVPVQPQQQPQQQQQSASPASHHPQVQQHQPQ